MPIEPALAILLAIIFVAFFVGTVIGFGTTILTVTFAAQLYPLDVLLPVVVPLNIALSVYLAIRHRRDTLWRPLLRRTLPLVATGVPIGLLLFNLRSTEWLRFGLGLLVVALAALQLRVSLRKVDTSHPLSTPPVIALLFGGGIAHGLYNVGGPMIVYVLGREIEDKGAFRSTLATMFVPLSTILIMDYAAVGLFNERTLTMTAIAVVPWLAGLWLGELAHRRVEQRSFKRAVWLLLLVGGVLLSLRAALAL